MTPSNNASLFFLWLGISMLMSLGALAALIWAIRAGQFSDQQRARYLALFSKTPGEEKSTGNEVKGGPQGEEK
jgi:cbb3-type cytochrome oxidase maturation protein